jgi:hypothetical protein
MKYSIVMALPLLVACASQAPVAPTSALSVSAATFVASSNSTSTKSVASVIDATALPLADPDAGRVCKKEKRPGSRIADTVCYTRREQLAKEIAGRSSISTLENEQHWRDQAIQQAIMDQRYPTGTGIGPD